MAVCYIVPFGTVYRLKLAKLLDMDSELVFAVNGDQYSEI
jgi:hypothetical protein